MTPTEKTVFTAIKAAAREGRVCPSNVDLGMLLDCRSKGTPSKAMQTLEADGHIIVQRYSNARIVTFPGADGLSTADPFLAVRSPNAGKLRVEHVGRGRAARAELGVGIGSPCSFCGANPAIGCDCQPRVQRLTILRGRMPPIALKAEIAA